MLGFPLILTSLICIILAFSGLLPKTRTNVLLAIASLLGSALLLFIYLALSLGINIQAGRGMAVVALPFLLLMLFPPLVGFGFLLRLVAETLLRRKIPCRNTFPWFLPIILAFIGIAVELAHHTPSATFHDFIADDAPQSLSDFQCWWQQVPGDCEFVLRFNLNPSEFDKILTRHKFNVTTDSTEIKNALDEYLRMADSRSSSGFRIALPDTQFDRMYSFSTEDDKGPHFMNVFTNDTRDMAIIYGDN